MLIRFQSENEQPLRAIEVALISLPTTAPTPPSSPPSPTTKTAAPPAPKKVTTPPPAPPAEPAEELLPPLPTETASERLSEALGGAINSILVPQKREMVSPIPTQEPQTRPSKDQSPLFGNLQLPSAPPTIARPKKLEPTELLNTPSAPLPTQTPQPSPTPIEPPAPTPAPAQIKRIPPEIKPVPAPPSLREVTPFARPKTETQPPKTKETPSIEKTLKSHLPNIQPIPPKPSAPVVSRRKPRTESKPQTSAPKISAPSLANIPQTPKLDEPVSTQPKMSDTVKKLMEGLKSKTRQPETPRVSQESSPPSALKTNPSPPSPTALDQQIAKLAIPEVTPVESIKQRLQLLAVQSSGDPGATAPSSPGKNRYLAMVEERIDRQWVAPPLLTSNPVVVLNFHISRSGEISRIQIAESSGNGHYDSAARRAVQAVNPLPSFPADISDSFFDVTYRFIKD